MRNSSTSSFKLRRVPARFRVSRHAAGFSMVEIVVALAIIAVGILGVLGLLPNALDSSRNAADNTMAATLVQDTFNSIRSQPFLAVDLSPLGYAPGAHDLQNSWPSVVGNFDQSGATAVNPQDYYYKVSITFTNQGTLSMSLVTATVTWPDKGIVNVAPPNTNIFFTEVAEYQ